MTDSRKLSAGICGLLLVAALGAFWWTRDSAPNRAPAAPTSAIDRRLLDSARQLAAIAETPAEQDLYRQAARLADHELDQAFATAVREAAAHKPPASGPLQQANARVAQTRARIAADQERIAKLGKTAASDDAAAGQLEVAKAQLALDEDEFEDAQLDLARQGGDERAQLERAAQEHAEAQKEPAPVKPVPLAGTETLSGQIGAWMELNDRQSRLEAARQQAVRHAATLEREHNSLEAMLEKKPAAAPIVSSDAVDDADVEEDPAVMVARLHNLSDQRKTLMELDHRIQDARQLAEAYTGWSTIVDSRTRGVLHLLLRSMAAILGVLLAVVLLEIGVRRHLRDQQDRRRMHQQRFLITLAIRAVAAIAVLFIVFGPPGQMPTIIGLATAGMTVVLKDFIVAFFGWFILIGRNGVRVGDWVEIKGVGGEVIEIGLFKTVLLEMGTGHPTGRRVSFMNGYAIEGVYFNFSTAGQWLWDELQVTVPAGADPYRTAERIREVVEKETGDEAQLAEQDWERITKQYGTRAFSARPASDLRPNAGGLDVHVRYITRGPQRHEVKSRLFKEIVALLHSTAPS
ncbi:MAG TPA: mechanosensitive ion channel domain-containing protein [Candidatus Solibacter sp.]|jgi:small-conductance mechanosensitive channel